MEIDQAKRLLTHLFQTQRVAVLATQGERGPYTSLMAVAATDDLKHILFATGRATRKFQNIRRNPRVALLLDNRSPGKSRTNYAVTAVGKTEKIAGEEREALQKIFLSKHPDLRPFVAAPDSAFLKCFVEEYVIVANFQDVTVIKPE